MRHLWEIDHAYYCSEGNYYSNDCHFDYKSWGEFLAENGTLDLNYNLVFRWDWREGEGWELPAYSGDDNYRHARLLLFIMHQRKGRFVCCEVEVCRADEPAIRDYLQPRLDYLARLWLPMQAETPIATTA